MSASPGADQLAMQLRLHGVPFEQEVQLCPSRRWRVDFYLAEHRLVVEVDGAVHRIKSRHGGDLEKGIWLVAEGYRLLRVSPQQVKAATALDAILWITGRLSAEEWARRKRLHRLEERAA